MHLSKNVSKFVTIATWFVFFIVTGFFVYRVFTSFVEPFFVAKEVLPPTLDLDSNLGQTAMYLREKGGLTVSTPSARLIEEDINPITAEVINGSGIVFAGRNLADSLSEAGIIVSKISNSSTEVSGTVISLKDKSLLYKDVVASKISTTSGEIRFDKLQDTYPFDIRIVIGR